MCTFNTSPCIPACACCRYTRRRVERTHDDVLNLHMGFFSVSHTTHTPHRPPHARQRERRENGSEEYMTRQRREERRPKTEDRRQKTEDRGTEDRGQKTEERGERREERRREKMKETREEIRRSRDQEKMKLNCLISCPPSGNQFDNSAPQLSFSKKKFFNKGDNSAGRAGYWNKCMTSKNAQCFSRSGF